MCEPRDVKFRKALKTLAHVPGFSKIRIWPDGALKTVFLKYRKNFKMYKLRDTKFYRDVKHQKYFTRVPGFSKILTRGLIGH